MRSWRIEARSLQALLARGGRQYRQNRIPDLRSGVPGPRAAIAATGCSIRRKQRRDARPNRARHPESGGEADPSMVVRGGGGRDRSRANHSRCARQVPGQNAQQTQRGVHAHVGFGATVARGRLRRSFAEAASSGCDSANNVPLPGLNAGKDRPQFNGEPGGTATSRSSGGVREREAHATLRRKTRARSNDVSLTAHGIPRVWREPDCSCLAGHLNVYPANAPRFRNCTCPRRLARSRDRA